MITNNNMSGGPQELEDIAHVSSRLPVATTPLPAFTLMAVVDADGYLIPLCTAGDLLRWCKVAWNAERN